MNSNESFSAREVRPGGGARPSMLSWRLDESLRDALDDERLLEETHKKLLSRLLTGSRTDEGVQVVVVVFVAALVWGSVAPLPLGIWMSVVFGTVAWRFLGRRSLADSSKTPSVGLAIMRRFVVLSAVAWALGPAVVARGLSVGDLDVQEVEQKAMANQALASFAAEAGIALESESSAAPAEPSPIKDKSQGTKTMGPGTVETE